MKKTLNAFIATLFLFLIAMPAQAVPCSAIVDRMCEAFDKMAKQINKCTSFEQFDKMDFSESIDSVDFDEFSDDCFDYVLTSGDKSKLTASVDKMWETTAKKLYEITGGAMTMDEIRAVLNPEKAKQINAIKNSKTVKELLECMNNL